MPAREGSGHFGKLNKQLWRCVDPAMISNIRMASWVQMRGDRGDRFLIVDIKQIKWMFISSTCLVCPQVNILSTVGVTSSLLVFLVWAGFIHLWMKSTSGKYYREGLHEYFHLMPLHTLNPLHFEKKYCTFYTRYQLHCRITFYTLNIWF